MRAIYRDARGRFTSCPPRPRDARGRFLPVQARPPRTLERVSWSPKVLKLHTDTLVKETGLSPKVVERIRKTKAVTPEERKLLYNLHRRRQVAELKAAGFNKELRDKLKSASPETIAKEKHTRREWAEFIAQWYNRPIKHILKGMSKTKMTSEEFELYMRQRYPHAFNDEDIIDSDEYEW